MRGGDATLPNCNAICTQSTVLLTATAIEHANSTSRSLPDSSSEEGECGRCPADEIVEEGVVRLLCPALLCSALLCGTSFARLGENHQKKLQYISKITLATLDLSFFIL
jgi:hypothetical protein